MTTTEARPRHYFDLLAWIHDRIRPRTYLEIGVNRGDSLSLARAGTVAVGVDPEADVTAPVEADVTVHRLTSDEFFARHTRADVFGDLPLDLAFIDGMHHAEVALRDFVNVERWTAPGTTVLLHDCWPRDEVTAARERTTVFWSGDVWRLVVALKDARPDLSVTTVDVPPTGLAVIRGLDPTSTSLAERYDEIVDRMLALDFSYLDTGKAEKLNRVDGDWATVARVVPG